MKPPSMPSAGQAADIASLSVPDALGTLRVNPRTGLTPADVEARRKEHGYNEVAEQKTHPVLAFLGKFWGVSAWMLELIMILSAVLREYSDLAVVGALLVVNAVLSFVQERHAAGVVDTLRKRLQVTARVLRDAAWQVIPARDLVPGDLIRVRPGDIIPADVKLLDGAPEASRRGRGGQGRALALRHRRRPCGRGHRAVSGPGLSAPGDGASHARSADERGTGRSAGHLQRQHGRRVEGAGRARRSGHAPQSDRCRQGRGQRGPDRAGADEHRDVGRAGADHLPAGADVDRQQDQPDHPEGGLRGDRARPSRKPETWKIGGFIALYVVLGVAMVAEALLLLWFGWSRFGLGTDKNALYTFSFLTLLYFSVFSIVSARERRWFWTTMPSGTLTAALAADVLICTVLTLAGIPNLPPLPGWQTAAIFGYALVSCLGVNDAVKVAMLKARARDVSGSSA